jgi:pilus assembly protein Flp/PilA
MTLSDYADMSIWFSRKHQQARYFSHTEMAGQKGHQPNPHHLGELMLHYIRSMMIARQSERGASAVEYGLLVGLIAVAIIITVGLLGGELDRLFGLVEDSLADAGTE